MKAMLDENLAYSTKKVVLIKDFWIGGFYYFLVLCIVLWILFYQMLFCNDQFLLKTVNGLSRVWVSHPTVNHCDPSNFDCKSHYRSLTDLEYCDEYTGTTRNTHKGACRYLDRTSLMPEGEVDNKIFFPTAVEVITERRTCAPGPENNHTCDNEYEELPGSDCLEGERMCNTRAGQTDQFYYVADAKSFVLQFTSSYEQGEVRGTSIDYPSYYEECLSQTARVRDHGRPWNERKQFVGERCTASDYVLKKMPCLHGVNCSTRHDFEVMNIPGMRSVVNTVKEGGDRSRKILSGGFDGGVGGTEVAVRAAAAAARAVTSRKKKEATGDSEAEEQPQPLEPSFLQKELRPHIQASRRSREAGRREWPWGHMAGDGEKLDDDQTHPAAVVKAYAVSQPQELNEEWTPTPEEEPGRMPEQYTNVYGDIFTLSRLFELAGANLDLDTNMDHWTTRQAGTVLEVTAYYENMYPWISTFGYRDVRYHYKVKELPLPHMSTSTLAAVQPDDYPETRRYEIRHGVLVWFRVDGEFGVFSLTYLLVMLVTASALLVSATTVTDLIAVYLHPRKDNYFSLKYECSPDFDSMWKCEKCGFFNSQLNHTCQRIAEWAATNETPPCGAPKPVQQPVGSAPESGQSEPPVP